MRDKRNISIRLGAQQDYPAQEFYWHSSASRVNTDAYMMNVLREEYSNQYIGISPAMNSDLLAFAAAGHAEAIQVDAEDGSNQQALKWVEYNAPLTRLDGSAGTLSERVFFAKYVYKWDGSAFVVYLIDGRDGAQSYPEVKNYYIIGDEKEVSKLILKTAEFGEELHDEIWVFKDGWWNRDAALYRNVKKASWDNVILDPDMKKALISDVERFYSSRDIYEDLSVPWKRGVIYHGPPGNGKTISIKATMNMLLNRKKPIPALYVRSLSSFAGPEHSIGEIFAKARQQAPCYLVFEDLDSLVSDGVRSYFLNEVDGLSSNEGIFMVGSTNHLEWLDPGISKRPSRFDRKFLFADPNESERVQYCEFWQRKLKHNKTIEFPHTLCDAIAGITDGFSFAYMQEAFVAALLMIAAGDKEDADASVLEDKDPKDAYILWREVKKQVGILRDEMGAKDLQTKAQSKATFAERIKVL